MKKFYHFKPEGAGYFRPEKDFTETIEIELEDIVTIDEYGSWEYEDERCIWARCPYDRDGEWYTDEYDIYIGDPDDIVEVVDELIETSMPAIPGKYKISGRVKIVYNISGVEAKYDYYLDEDDLLAYDRELYTDEVKVELDPYESRVSNFKFKKLN